MVVTVDIFDFWKTVAIEMKVWLIDTSPAPTHVLMVLFRLLARLLAAARPGLGTVRTISSLVRRSRVSITREPLFLVDWRATIQLLTRCRCLHFSFAVPHPSGGSLLPSEHVPAEEHSCCTGCGVVLQSRDQNRRGYIPEGVWKRFQGNEPAGSNTDESKDTADTTLICQRCFKLKYYSSALNVTVPEDEYLHHLRHLKEKRALILLVVDVTDFPGSLFPDLSSLIKQGNPIFIVANKIDLLAGYSTRDLSRLGEHMRAVGMERSLQGCQVTQVLFVSAKEGTGIRSLTRSIVTHWGNRGDVYLLGCTNVGKSSLFNHLLWSLCGAQPGQWSPADELTAPAATISQWPGTTLDLLSFPIMSMGKRRRLLAQARRRKKQNLSLDGEDIDHLTQWPPSSISAAPIQGDFPDTEEVPPVHAPVDVIQVDEVLEEIGLRKKLSQTDQRQPVATSSIDTASSDARPQHRFWLHDTPGAVNSTQLINLLTTEELKLCLPQKPLVPRTFILKPGQTLLIGGLARLDYTQGDVSAYFTVFCSSRIPIHATRLDKADTVYSKNLGGPLLMVPCGDAERLSWFPALLGEEHTVTGVGWKSSCADIVLSSAGWVAVTMGVDMKVSLKAFTPSGKGMFVRVPSLFPSAVNERGKRSRKGNRTSYKGRK